MQPRIDDSLDLIGRQLAGLGNHLHDLAVIVIQNGFHFFAECGTHFRAAVWFSRRLEFTDPQHLRLDRQHVKQVLVKRNFSTQPRHHQHARFRQDDLIAGGGQQIILCAATFHPGVDLPPLLTHLLDTSP